MTPGKRAAHDRPRQVHLGVHVAGVADAVSVVRLATTAERARFDFLSLVEGPGLPVLSALAGVTERLGLVATTGAGRPFEVPRSPRVPPVLFGAGRDPGAADVILGPARPLHESRIHYREVKNRLAAAGRERDDVLLLPGVTFALGATTREAQANAAALRRQQISGAAAIQFLEAVWNRDLSSYDPDGPLPLVDPDPGPSAIARGTAHTMHDPEMTAREWRRLAAERGLSIRELAVEKAARQTFVGTPDDVADQIDLRVQTHAADGFVLVPHPGPGGLDEFAATVVPLLQERGVLRTHYEGTTLRDHLGLPPAGTRRPIPSQTTVAREVRA